MNGFNGFYFSFITLSTVGYGDITPVSRIARWLAAMEAMTGMLYVGVLIASLVSLYSAPNPMIRVPMSSPDLCADPAWVDEALREAGCDEIDKVHVAFLENDDKVSVIPKNT
jgi:hypothetical protein